MQQVLLHITISHCTNLQIKLKTSENTNKKQQQNRLSYVKHFILSRTLCRLEQLELAESSCSLLARRQQLTGAH